VDLTGLFPHAVVPTAASLPNCSFTPENLEWIARCNGTKETQADLQQQNLDPRTRHPDDDLLERNRRIYNLTGNAFTWTAAETRVAKARRQVLKQLWAPGSSSVTNMGLSEEQALIVTGLLDDAWTQVSREIRDSEYFWTCLQTAAESPVRWLVSFLPGAWAHQKDLCAYMAKMPAMI
jgi:hypothetical protein